MTTTTTPTRGATDLLDLIEAYAEARHRQGRSSYNAQTAAALQAVKDALAAWQATAAQAAVQDDLITIRKPTTSAEMLLLLKLARLVISDVDKTLEETLAPAQPVAEQGVAYAALPDLSDANGEIWSAIIYWKHAKRGEDALRKASELERVLSDQMRAFADATCALRASHGQAPATQPAHQQEAQEPVAVVVPCYTPSGKRVALYSAKQDLPIGTQLYTAPQPAERAPLTANQVSGLAESAGYWHGDMSRADFINGIRCAEVAHGIKGENHDR